MEQKRLILATTLSVLVFVVWYLVVIPRLMPQKPRPARNAAVADNADPADSDAENPAVDDDSLPDAGAPASVSPAATDDTPEGEVVEKPRKTDRPRHPLRDVQLGSADPKSGFRQFITLTSQGAAVSRVELNDPRYIDLRPPHGPLVVLGADDVLPRSLELAVPQLQGNLRKLNWEVVDLQPAEPPHAEVTFQLEIDGVQIRKRYLARQVDLNATARPEAAAYGLELELEFRNLTDRERV
ncbi:MAG: hypothetical protein EHM42_15770, partial [Planctomycetaceae bacterium]